MSDLTIRVYGTDRTDTALHVNTFLLLRFEIRQIFYNLT